MFVPLRIHSVFSKGRGGATVAEAASWAGERRLPAAALADIGNGYGRGKGERGRAWPSSEALPPPSRRARREEATSSRNSSSAIL